MKSWGAVESDFGNRSWSDIIRTWAEDAIKVNPDDLRQDDLMATLEDKIQAQKDDGATTAVLEFRRAAAFSDLAAARLKARAAHREAIRQVYAGRSSLAVSTAHDAFLFHCRFIAASLGAFVGVHNGNYCAVDVFPWMGLPPQTKAFVRANAEWRTSLKWYYPSGKPFSQDDLFNQFQRLLRVTSGLPITDARRRAFFQMDKRRTSSLRNDTIYQSSCWYFYDDLLCPSLPTSLWVDLKMDAADYTGDRAHFHPLGPATMIGGLATAIWDELTNSCAVLREIPVDDFDPIPIEAQIMDAPVLPP